MGHVFFGIPDGSDVRLELEEIIRRLFMKRLNIEVIIKIITTILAVLLILPGLVFAQERLSVTTSSQYAVRPWNEIRCAVAG